MGHVSRQRQALTEAAFRVANERMRSWQERHRAARREPYYCECSDARCRARVQLRREEYEAVRADPRRFVVLRGHETSDVERVVEVRGGYSVVEKSPEVSAIVRRSDPRGA